MNFLKRCNTSLTVQDSPSTPILTETPTNNDPSAQILDTPLHVRGPAVFRMDCQMQKDVKLNDLFCYRITCVKDFYK